MKNLLKMGLVLIIVLLYGCEYRNNKENQVNSGISAVNAMPIEFDKIIDTVSFSISNKAYFEFPDEMSFYKWSQNHISVYNNQMNFIGVIDSKKDIYYGIQMYNHRINNTKIYRIESRATTSALSSGEFGTLQLDRVTNSKKNEVYYILHDGKTDFALDIDSRIETNLKSALD